MVLLDYLKNTKIISKFSWSIFIIVGISIIYFANEENLDNLLVIVGYFSIIFGFLYGFIVFIITLKLETYEHIIKQYDILIKSNTKIIGEERKEILRIRSDNIIKYNNRKNDEYVETDIPF